MQSTHMQQCFKLTHPVNMWSLILRVCSKFIGWFIDTGSHCANTVFEIDTVIEAQLEAIESSHTFDLH